MIDLMIANWDSVLVVVLFLALLVYLAKKGAEKKINSMLLYLVLEAEILLGGGTGQLKFSAVSTWLYEKMPVILKLLFTEKQIANMINEAVEKLKKYLESNTEAQKIVSLSSIEHL